MSRRLQPIFTRLHRQIDFGAHEPIGSAQRILSDLAGTLGGDGRRRGGQALARGGKLTMTDAHIVLDAPILTVGGEK